jgi:hypothetical protein
VGGACGTYRGEESCNQELAGKPEGKRPLVKSTHRTNDNIKIDLREAGWKDIHWINQANVRNKWQASVKMVINLWFPQEFENSA